MIENLVIVLCAVTWMRICRRLSTGTWRSEALNRASLPFWQIMWPTKIAESIFNGSRTSSLSSRSESKLCSENKSEMFFFFA